MCVWHAATYESDERVFILGYHDVMYRHPVDLAVSTVNSASKLVELCSQLLALLALLLLEERRLVYLHHRDLALPLGVFNEELLRY